jgi:hypothetical protein
LEQHSSMNVLQAISDSKSLEIFREVANGTVESDVLKQKEGMTKKQFYSRMQALRKVGLVKRRKARFSLTNFGIIVYHAESVIEAGVGNCWKLRAIDSIQNSEQIGQHERMKLIKTILNDNTIEDIIVKQR